MFALAGHLGMTVAELAERMDAAELAEWTALIAVEPWGPFRQDYHAAVTAWSNLAPWSRGAQPKDFFPKWGQQEEKFVEVPSLEDQADFIRSLVARVSSAK